MENHSTANRYRTCILTAAACAALALGPTIAFAQVNPNTVPPPAMTANSGNDLGFYLNGDLGPSFMPDFQSSRFGFPGSFSARPGARFGIEPGYNFMATDQLTLGGEFETGMLYNRLNSISAAGSPLTLRGDFYQVPMLGNLVLKLHPSSFIIPYVGVGGGGDYSRARINWPGFAGYDRHSDEVDPAVQAMAGVRFHVLPNIDVGIGYEFLAAFPSEGSALENHTVSASVSVKF